jgi:L-fucose isomerase-like protein
MNDLINRVEAKAYQESEINIKLSRMRQKLKYSSQNNSDSQESSDNSSQLVKIFKIEKVSNEIANLETDESQSTRNRS